MKRRISLSDESWKCVSCSVLNSINQQTCEKCGAKKPWKCSKPDCHKLNPHYLLECQHCGTRKNESNISSSSSQNPEFPPGIPVSPLNLNSNPNSSSSSRRPNSNFFILNYSQIIPETTTNNSSQSNSSQTTNPNPSNSSQPNSNSVFTQIENIVATTFSPSNQTKEFGLIGQIGKPDSLKADKIIQYLSESIAENRCTRSVTGSQFIYQNWFDCRSCSTANNMIYGVCEACAKHCHRGHELSPKNTSGFFCDCSDIGSCSIDNTQWSGLFWFEQDSNKKIPFTIIIYKQNGSNNLIKGKGRSPVGVFKFSGEEDIDSGNISFSSTFENLSYCVKYKGKKSGNVIEGTLNSTFGKKGSFKLTKISRQLTNTSSSTSRPSTNTSSVNSRPPPTNTSSSTSRPPPTNTSSSTSRPPPTNTNSNNSSQNTNRSSSRRPREFIFVNNRSRGRTSVFSSNRGNNNRNQRNNSRNIPQSLFEPISASVSFSLEENPLIPPRRSDSSGVISSRSCLNQSEINAINIFNDILRILYHYNHRNLPHFLVQNIKKSCLFDFMRGILRSNNVLEIKKRIKLFIKLLNVCRELVIHKELHDLFFFHTNNSNSIVKLLYKLRKKIKIALKFQKYYFNKYLPNDEFEMDKKLNFVIQTIIKIEEYLLYNHDSLQFLDNNDESRIQILFNDLNEISKEQKQSNNNQNNQMKDSEENSNKFLEKSLLYESKLNNLKFKQVPVFQDHVYKNYYIHSSRITENWVNRLSTEFASLSQILSVSFCSAVFVRVLDFDLSKVKIMLTGPIDTPYSCGCFFFDAFIPSIYPNFPPKVTFITTGGGRFAFNPFLNDHGDVFLSILGTQSDNSENRWDENLSLIHIIDALKSQIFISEPVFNDASIKKLRGTQIGMQKSKKYNIEIRRATLQSGILENLLFPPNEFAEAVRNHFLVQKEWILSRLDKWISEDDKCRETANKIRIELDKLEKREKESMQLD